MFTRQTYNARSPHDTKKLIYSVLNLHCLQASKIRNRRIAHQQKPREISEFKLLKYSREHGSSTYKCVCGTRIYGAQSESRDRAL